MNLSNPTISYSTLKQFLFSTENFNYGGGVSLGSLVDTLLTSPDDLNKNYIITDIKTDLTDDQYRAVKIGIRNYLEYRDKDSAIATIVDYLEGLYKTDKAKKSHLEIIEPYFTLQYNNLDKKIINVSFYKKALTIVEKFRNSKGTSKYTKNDGLEVFYQKKIEYPLFFDKNIEITKDQYDFIRKEYPFVILTAQPYEINNAKYYRCFIAGFYIKGIIDRLQINHETKKITIIDFKTTKSFLTKENVINTIEMFHYDLQGLIYTLGIKYLFINNLKYKNYQIDGYKIAIASTTDLKQDALSFDITNLIYKNQSKLQTAIDNVLHFILNNEMQDLKYVNNNYEYQI